jgi:LCP family protein required for cell wall assembly
LIIGSDSRANIDPSDPNQAVFIGGENPTGQRSDTILLVRIDPVKGDAKMLSFPRDLWVPIAGKDRSAKINSAYGEGRAVLVDTIRQNFGVEINNFIEVDFVGFQDLVEAIGGVPIYFETPMRDDNTGLNVQRAGCVTLSGEQALAFARSRHLEYLDSKGRWQTDPTADLGRITRQQIFVRRAMAKVLTLGIATNLKTFFDLLDVATSSVTLDQTINRSDLRDLAERFKSLQAEDIKTYALPVSNGSSSDGQSILNMKQGPAQPILNVFRGIDPGPVLESDVVVDVQTSRTNPLRGKDVQAALNAVGFVDGSVSNPATVPEQTTIYYGAGSEYAADVVARHLTSTAVLAAEPSLAANHVVLAAGLNFTTVMVTPRPAAPLATTTTVAPATKDTNPTTVPSTTSTTVIGVTPGSTPEGVSC